MSTSAALCAGLALLLVALWRLQRAPGWAAWVLLAAFPRACALREPRPGPALSALEVQARRAEPLLGRWRTRADQRSGWIEPFEPGDEAPLLLEPCAPPPEEGSTVLLLPSDEVSAWARGPEPAPGERARRFAGSARFLPDELVLLAAAPRGLAGALAEPLRSLRSWLGARAAAIEGERSAGLLVALATGERGGLTSARSDLFARTGTSHLLAISGWHVGLFALLVLRPLARATPRSGQACAGFLVRAALLLVFAAVAGAEKPVLRAALAVLLLQLASLRRRSLLAPPLRPDGLSFLGAAFTLECLFDPAGIRALSLSLSYAATLGLMLGMGPLNALLRAERGAWPDFAPGPLRRTTSVLWKRGVGAFASGLAASAAAVLATLPLAWTSFGECAPAGILLTVLSMPSFTFLSLLAWLGALLPWAGLRAPAELGAHALYALLEFGDALPGTPWLVPPRPFAALALATALTFLALRSPWARAPAALTWGILLLPWSAAPAGFELHALDVGHGSCLVGRAPGLEALVFDAGSRDRRAVASEALLPLLARWEVARPQVVLSHGHQDHASGLARLAERLPPWQWLGAWPAQETVRLPHGSAAADLEAGALGLRSPCPELGLRLMRGSPSSGNEGSRALLLTWRGERLLLLGDAEEAGLRGLELAPGPLRLLLAPHHGSEAPGLAPLLERCPPEIVWVSASGRPGIAGELLRRMLPWRWTARDGPLALRLP